MPTKIRKKYTRKLCLNLETIVIQTSDLLHEDWMVTIIYIMNSFILSAKISAVSLFYQHHALIASGLYHRLYSVYQSIIYLAIERSGF